MELAERWLCNTSDSFNRWFAGFDLAGAESARKPAELREAFAPVRRNCLNLTIHAGEGSDPDNIWEATHELNAERIGHGLTLDRNKRLLDYLRRRRITVEMCPSSNNQIVGFRDLAHPASPDYPLAAFVESGLRVTVNTDDPGMSRTTLSREFHSACNLSPEGLSRWQVLQLIRNAFQAAFCPPDQRKDLLLRAERQILSLLT